MDRTKRSLAIAAESVLREKSLTDATVAAICDEALLSRQTFYRHFHDKHELIQWTFDQIFDKTFLHITRASSWAENIRNFLSEIQKFSHLFASAYAYDGQNNLWEYHFARAYGVYEDYYEMGKGSPIDEEEKFSLELHCHGSISMMAQWLRNGCRETPAEMTALFFSAMPQHMQNRLVLRGTAPVTASRGVKTGEVRWPRG